jgi:UDP-glucose 4-epimerase
VKVLITGGAGFIGSHLCEYLIRLGYEVPILDNLTTGSKNNIDSCKGAIFISGDITNKELVDKLVSRSDTVFHLAAAVGVKTILSAPIKSMQTNFIGSEIVISACSRFDKRLMIASTSEIYGKNLKQPLAENDDRVMGSPQKLRWSYADSKSLEEALAHAYFLNSKLNVTTIRFFNIVGPRQSSAYGMVLPNFIENAIIDKPIRVFGDGNQTRVFCHVKDAIEAIVKLINRHDTIGEVFNVGGSQEISIMDLAVRVKRILSSKSNIILESYENFYEVGFEDMMRRTPDLSKLSNFINWQPKFDLDSIIKDISKSYSK